MFASGLNRLLAGGALLASAAAALAASDPPADLPPADLPPEFQQIIPRGRIASVDQPEFVNPGEAEIPGDAWVLGVEIDGKAKAYSLNLLNQHEIVNDRIGEQAFAAETTACRPRSRSTPFSSMAVPTPFQPRNSPTAAALRSPASTSSSTVRKARRSFTRRWLSSLPTAALSSVTVSGVTPLERPSTLARNTSTAAVCRASMASTPSGSIGA